MVKRVIARSHDEMYFLEEGLGCRNDGNQRMREVGKTGIDSLWKNLGAGAVLEKPESLLPMSLGRDGGRWEGGRQNFSLHLERCMGQGCGPGLGREEGGEECSLLDSARYSPNFSSMI